MPGPVVAEHGHAIVVGGGDQDTRAHVTLEMKYKDGGCIVDNFPFFWLFLFLDPMYTLLMTMNPL